jgi:cytochrome bd-type quinol oxidase subunit 2
LVFDGRLRPLCAAAFSPGQVKRVVWTDVVTITLIVWFALVESRRGSVAATADAASVLAGVTLAEAVYPRVVSAAIDPYLAYCTVVSTLLVLAFIASWYTAKTISYSPSRWDRLLAGAGGVVLGVTVSYAIFHALKIGYGNSYAAFRHSLMRPIVHDFRWYHALMSSLGLESGRW